MTTPQAVMKLALDALLTKKAALAQLSPCMHDECKQPCIEWRDAADADADKAIAALRSALSSPMGVAETPANRWTEAGEPDPHGKRYECQRAELAMGNLTDDELANGAFLNYDQRLSVADMINPKPGQHMPIAWMTAVKDRIRWLSRALEAEKQDKGHLAACVGGGVTQWQPIASAPKDGCLLLGCTLKGVVQVIKFNKHLCIWVEPDGRESARTMAYWMPLPPAPAGQESGPDYQKQNDELIRLGRSVGK